MNNHRLLTGLLAATLLSGGVHASAQSDRIFSIEELFEIAETNSVQLRPSFSAEDIPRILLADARNFTNFVAC